MDKVRIQEIFDEVLTEGFTIPQAAASFLAFKFAMFLKKDFKQWPAYKLGLIDDKGAKIKDPSSSLEKNALNPLMNMVRKIKQIMHKVVPSKAILTTLVALYLLKENKATLTHSIEIKEQISKFNSISLLFYFYLLKLKIVNRMF
jgi:hypothetical protein